MCLSRKWLSLAVILLAFWSRPLAAHDIYSHLLDDSGRSCCNDMDCQHPVRSRILPPPDLEPEVARIVEALALEAARREHARVPAWTERSRTSHDAGGHLRTLQHGSAIRSLD